MNRDDLTARQRAVYERVLREAVDEGTPVSTLLLREDMLAEDRAAVADAFTPGTGKDYL